MHLQNAGSGQVLTPPGRVQCRWLETAVAPMSEVARLCHALMRPLWPSCSGSVAARRHFKDPVHGGWLQVHSRHGMSAQMFGRYHLFHVRNQRRFDDMTTALRHCAQGCLYYFKIAVALAVAGASCTPHACTLRVFLRIRHDADRAAGASTCPRCMCCPQRSPRAFPPSSRRAWRSAQGAQRTWLPVFSGP